MGEGGRSSIVDGGGRAWAYHYLLLWLLHLQSKVQPGSRCSSSGRRLLGLGLHGQCLFSFSLKLFIGKKEKIRFNT